MPSNPTSSGKMETHLTGSYKKTGNKKTPPENFSDGVSLSQPSANAGLARTASLLLSVRLVRSRSGDRLPMPGWTVYRNLTRDHLLFGVDSGRGRQRAPRPAVLDRRLLRLPFEAQNGTTISVRGHHMGGKGSGASFRVRQLIGVGE